MPSVLANRTYRRLFAARAVAPMGAGLDAVAPARPAPAAAAVAAAPANGM